MILAESSIRKLISLIIERGMNVQSMAANFDDKEEIDGEFEFEGDVSFENSKSVKASVGDRAVRLGKKLGIDPAWIYAEEAKESNHNPKAMAWNLHIMVNPKYASKAGVPNKAVTEEQKAQLVSQGFPSSLNKSYYGSEAQTAFKKAYKINPWAAISGGAWGLYQVLGAFTLPKYDNDPKVWSKAFENNTLKYCEDSLVTWINLYGKEFKDAVNRGDYAYTTKKYYGAPNSKYENFIRSHVAKYKKGLPVNPPGGSKAKSSWKGRLGKFTARDINFHKLIKGGKNNYRSGMKPRHVNASVDFFKSLKKDFKIDTVITLNADNSGRSASNNAKAAGMTVMYAPASDSGGKLNIQNYSFNQIVKQLDKGNTLVHCTHGADRTGAVVGRYYARKGMSVEAALEDAYKYKSGGESGFMAGPKAFIEKS